MKIPARAIYMLDILVLAGSAIAIIAIIGYVQPMLIAPTDAYITSNTSVLFTFSKGDAVYIDDNPDFTSPEIIEARNTLIVNLEPGVYYWRVEGATASEVRTLNIQSKIDLMLKESGGNYEVVNAGNTPLNVTIYDSTRILENIIVGIDEKANASGNKFEGRQHG